MSKTPLVTSNQSDAIRDMANAKGVGRTNWQRAHDDGRFAQFLDGLKESTETTKTGVPKHLYEFRIKKDGADASTLIGRTRPTFFVSEYAEAMTENKKEFIGGPKEDASIRVFTCESLGVTGWSETDFFGPKGFAHIKKFGLDPCVSDDAFPIRAEHADQKLDEWILIAHKPISVHGYSCVFRVGRDRVSGRSVYGYSLRSVCRLGSGDLVALRVAGRSQS